MKDNERELLDVAADKLDNIEGHIRLVIGELVNILGEVKAAEYAVGKELGN